MSLKLNEWDDGISYWKSTKWPRDLHYDFYLAMATSNNEKIFTDAWWNGFLNSLSSWRAIRPKSLSEITNRAKERFSSLDSIWKDKIIPIIKKDIDSVCWENIKSFTHEVQNIKVVESPVFTSKFCHFLAPKIFPIVDNAAMGQPFSNYRACFNAYKMEWQNTDELIQIELKRRLKEVINKNQFDHYPEKNKIIEICLIGRHQNRKKV